MELPARAALGETVADVIRTAILNGTLKPGHTLQENTLSRQLSVSRSPIREALLQLERERLVEGRINKPSVVRKPSPEEIFQIYTIRSALEGIAARWAADRATPELIAELRSQAEKLHKMTPDASKREPADFLSRASDFHAAIADASGSPDLQYVLRNLRNQIRMVMAAGLASLTDRRAEEIHDEHMALISAIAAGDGDRAEQLAASHVRSARDRIVHASTEGQTVTG